MAASGEPLPIAALFDDVHKALRSCGSAVVVAPPGSGKSTALPLHLLRSGQFGDKTILLLEPRRLAARHIAEYLAECSGEDVGGRIGFAMRGASRVSKRTRLLVVTEGLLIRRLQTDPALEDIGLILFDEFHERHLVSDLSLALSLDCRAGLNPKLNLIVMSATIDAEPVAALLGDAPVLSAEGCTHPVDTRYVAPAHGKILLEPRQLAAHVVQAVEQALGEPPPDETLKDMLVFLPGEPEIHRVAAALANRLTGPEIDIRPLYGALPFSQQRAALAPATAGRRKIVLATAIAETSLTVEGIGIVIDSGASRVATYHAGTGMGRLVTEKVTRATAAQRSGRAGRLGPGRCLRLWSEAEHRGLIPFAEPEMMRADLMALALEIAAWGVPDAAALHWLDPPPTGHLLQAQNMLRQLGALPPEGAGVTPYGRALAEMGLHPRLSHLLKQGQASNTEETAVDLVLLLEHGSRLRRALMPSDPHNEPVLISALLQQWQQAPRKNGRLRTFFADRQDFRRRLARASADTHTARTAEKTVAGLLAAAFPDRIAVRQSTRTNQNGSKVSYQMSGAGAVVCPLAHELAQHPYLVVCETDGARPLAALRSAEPISRAQLEHQFEAQLSKHSIVEWDSKAGRLSQKGELRLGQAVLRAQPEPISDDGAVLQAIIAEVNNVGLSCLPWSRAAKQLRNRMQFMATEAALPDWPDCSDAWLQNHVQEWLGATFTGIRKHSDITAQNLEAPLTWQQHKQLENGAPATVCLDNGLEIAVRYEPPARPFVAIRLQRLLGTRTHPVLLNGRYPLPVHILSPADRPIQITRNIPGFWLSSYPDVRKAMRGRYPKHAWPEDPLALHTRPTR